MSSKKAPETPPKKDPAPWLKRIHAPAMLKAWRDRERLSKSEAASKFGLDLAFYVAIERGRKRPGLDIATRIQTATLGHVQATQWAIPRDARKGTPKVAPRAA